MTTNTDGFVSEAEEEYPRRCRTCRSCDCDPVPTFLRPLPPTPSLAASIASCLKTPFKRVSTLKKSQREKILEGWGGAAQVMCTVCSFLTPSFPPDIPPSCPPIFGQHHVLEGQLQSSGTIPNSCPPGRRNKRNANSSTIPNSPSSFCKASRRQNATHIPQFTFSIFPSSYTAGPATYPKSPIQGKYTTGTIEKTPLLDNIWPYPTPSWPQHQSDQCHRDRLWIWLALSIWIIWQY